MEKIKEAAATHRGARGPLLRWALWFVLVNAALLMLVSLSYVKSMALPETTAARAFMGLSLPGHSVTLAAVAFPVIAVAILVWPRRAFVFGTGIILEALLLLLIVVDALVFAQYRFHLNGMVWNLLTSGAAGDVLPVTGKLYAVLAGAVLQALLLQWGIARLAWRHSSRGGRRYGRCTAVLVFMVVLGGHVMHAWASANSYTPITNQVRYLPGYKPLTMTKLLVKLGLADPKQGPKFAAAKGGTALRYPVQPITCAPQPGKKLNLMLIVIDSWRFDALTAEVTPNIARFARDKFRFDNHYSGGNCTRFGIFSLFYGISGSYWHSMLAEERPPVLLQELERQRYASGIYASAPLVNPEFDHTVFAAMRDRIELRQQGSTPQERDRTITDKMLRFLARPREGKPFFGFLFYDAPHAADHPAGATPFQPAAAEINYLTLNNGTDPVPILNKYRNSLRYVDALVGEVLAALKKEGHLDDTVVMITGDHGQEFNDLKMNYWGHNGNFSRYQVQTPLVVSWPGRKGTQVAYRTSHLDVVPTLMHGLLGCTNAPSQYSNGRYLFDSAPRAYLMASSWDTMSVIEPDRTTVSLPAGEVDILDERYRPVSGAVIRPQIVQSAMEEAGRFFAR